MSYGFLALNDDNDVLISSDTKNLHFAGKATAPSAPTATFTNHGGFVELDYTITLSNRTAVPVPFFTMPHLDWKYAIAGVKGVNSGSSNKTWTIKIIRTNANSLSSYMPEVYVFVEPQAISVSEAYGFQVFNADGTVSFDSRARPLAVTNAVSVYQPANPLSSSSVVTLSANSCADINNNAFTPVVRGIFLMGPTASHPTKPMYHYNALAQTQREAAFSQFTESCTGISAYGVCLGYESSLSVLSTYWAFYRGGIGEITTSGNGTFVKAGWIPCQAGCHYASSSSGDFLFIFGPGSSASGGGTWPYSDETINLTPQTIIVADASRYD
jgi:hypothetical protein